MKRHPKNRAVNPRRLLAWLAALVCALVVIPLAGLAQEIFIGPGFGGRRGGIAMPADAAVVDPDAEKDPDALFPTSAILKTDPDIDRLMRRAQELTDEQRFDVSATLWQQVLDRSGSELTTRPDWVDKRGSEESDSEWLQTYRSVRNEVERLLAAMPREGLAQYRIVADGPARTLMAGAQNEREEPALDEIVRRYFVSSVGDDAAFRLGCLLLDRHDFVGAARMFDKILAIHPDPTMTREEVMLRLAVCQARTGNRLSAERTYATLAASVKARPASVSGEAFALVGRDVQKNHLLVADTFRASGDWTQPLGTAARDGHMAALAADGFQGDLHESWSYRTDVFDGDALQAIAASGANEAQRNEMLMRRRAMGYADETPPQATPTREALVDAWKDSSWTPTAQALLVAGKIIFRTPTRIACYDATAVGEPRLLWMAPPDGSLTPDGKEFDPENIDRLKSESTEWARLSAYLQGMGASSGPSDYRGVMMFGDRIPQSMAAANNTVYYVDDMPQLRPDLDPQTAVRAWAGMMGGGDESRAIQSRSKLLAIDGTTGKILWEWPGDVPAAAATETPVATPPIDALPAGVVPRFAPGAGGAPVAARAVVASDAEKPSDDFRFLGPPIPHRRMLYIPAYANGGLWVYAIETAESKSAAGKRVQTRKLGWRTALCDDPQTGGDRWAPVGMCLDGGDLFVSTGRGAVFSLDATAGAIRWAVRYNRTMSHTRGGNNRFGGVQQAVSFQGWDENYVIARGPWILLMASDYRNLIALNRGTGEFAWPGVGVDDVRYVLGVAGDNLFVAGPKVIRAHSFRREGAISWEVALEESSHGRGALTSDSVYIPVKDKIQRYSLTGELLSTANVHFARDRNDPVGNLFTDGKTLFSVGPERVYALTNAPVQLKRLDAEIAAGEKTLAVVRAAGIAEDIADESERYQALRRRRMLLRGRAGQIDAAVEDLRAVQTEAGKGTGADKALAIALAAIEELELARRAPEKALAVLVGTDGAMTTLTPAAREALPARQKTQVSSLLAASLEAISAAETPPREALPLVLQAIGQWPDDTLRTISDLAIKATATAESADVLRAGLKAESPRLRAAAAGALDRALGAKATEELAALLSDPAEEVRVAAARALIERGDRRALAPLVAMLESPTVAIRHEASRLLIASTGEPHSLVAYAPEKDRAAVVAKWKAWLAASGPTAKLKVPLDFRLHRVGRILVTDFDAGLARELDSEGNVLWTSPRIPGAWGCQGLPNGHRLVCSFQSLYVVEFDENGKEVWRSDGRLRFYPTSVQRLYNGNTLVAGRELDDKSGVVVEIGRDGKVIADTQVRLGLRPYDLRMLENGTLLAACTYENVICQLNRNGVRVERTTIESVSRPESARRLGDGHFLVVDNGGKTRIVTDRVRGVRSTVHPGRVLEYDENLRLVNSTNEATALRDAERLDNGNLLILGSESIKEQTPDGKTVWSKAFTGGKRLSVY